MLLVYACSNKNAILSGASLPFEFIIKRYQSTLYRLIVC